MAINLGGLGASLGSALGTGLAAPINQGLDLLAQRKMNQIKQAGDLADRQRKADAFRIIRPDLTPEQAMAFTYIPEKSIFEALQFNPGQQEQQNESMQALQGQQQQQPENVMDYLQQAQAQQPEANIQALLNPQNMIQSILGRGQQTPRMMQPQPRPQAQQQQQQVQEPKIAQPKGLLPQRSLLPPKGAESAAQRQIDATNKPYITKLDAKRDFVSEGIKAGSILKEELESGDVVSGIGGFVPNFLLGTGSQRFDQAGDDLAAALTGLEKGAQTISKIKFNKNRKPNLKQNRETQITRTQDMLNLLSSQALELDLNDYLINSNGGFQPRNLSTQVANLYKKLEHVIPPVPEGAQEGDQFKDKKTGVKWIVRGPIMRFDGFINKG